MQTKSKRQNAEPPNGRPTVKPKVLSLPVSLAKQEVSAFSCFLLIDLYVYTGRGFLKMPKSTVMSKMLSLPVSLACQTGGVSIYMPSIN